MTTSLTLASSSFSAFLMATPGAAGRRDSGESKEGRWPAIKPKNALQINCLEGTLLFTIPGFLTTTEAKSFIVAAESLGFIHQGTRPERGELFRDNDRISVIDPVLAESIWDSGLKSVFSENNCKLEGKTAVGLNPDIRFYRYKKGQQFGRHYDASVDFGEGRRTLYTLLIYLSGSPVSKTKDEKESSADYLVGGETVFFDENDGVMAEVAPVVGMAALHIHGAERGLFHEARAVMRNVKYVLRSDVVFA